MAFQWADAEPDSDDTMIEVPRGLRAAPKKLQRRKRAPANGGDLDPGMRCPLGRQQLKAVDGAVQLGLCGPSELQQSLRRARLELTEAPCLKLPPSQTLDADVAAALRAKIRHLTRAAGAEVLRPSVGRADITELVLSFLSETQPLTATQTGGLMHTGTGSANLDLFFQTVPQPIPEANRQLQDLLAQAWVESPQTCLRQIFLLGASREGKQDRYSFYDAMLWLWEQQPATVLANLHLVPETNYWKGLLELLARVCEGPRRSLERDQALHDSFSRGSRKLLARGGKKYPTEGWKPGSRLELAREALKRYDEDPLYRALFERTGQLFADQLREDAALMRAGQRVSLCAKWCPLLYHSFDRRTLICEAIARWLFPWSLPEFEGTSEREYAYRARNKLRQTLSELKEYMKPPERLMCQGRWSEIAYKAVPAACMRINAKHFMEHDARRFLGHVDKLASGQVKANTGALQPHEILKDVQAVATEFDPIRPAIAQAQWEAMKAEVKAGGALDGCIPVCDVSGSMTCEAAPNVSCMDVAVSLSLLLAEVAEGPYARKLITFHEDPRIVELPATRQLVELDRFTRSLPWGMSTNFFKVFDLLLRMEPAPKRIFVFSDMQFSSAGGQATDFQRARELYEAAGRAMPEVVFWNLSPYHGAPAVADDTGAALVSGFSSVMMRLLLQEGSPDKPTQQAAPEPESPLSDAEVKEPMEAEESGETTQDETEEREETSSASRSDEANGDADAEMQAEQEQKEEEEKEEEKEEVDWSADEESSKNGPVPEGDCEEGPLLESCSQAAQVEGAKATSVEEHAQEATREDPAGEKPLSDKQLQALEVLAKALDKPLLQRPRVVHCAEEALRLFHGPQQPINEQWAVGTQASGGQAAPAPAPEPASEVGSARWTTQSLHLGTLPCKEAVAAFLGNSNLKELHEELHQFLRRELKACRRGVRVWLDVETQELPAPLLERGEVKVTAKARVAPGRLRAALAELPELARPSVERAVARAERPRPRTKRARREEDAADF